MNGLLLSNLNEIIYESEYTRKIKHYLESFYKCYDKKSDIISLILKNKFRTKEFFELLNTKPLNIRNKHFKRFDKEINYLLGSSEQKLLEEWDNYLFFNQSSCQADYNFWSKQQYFSIEEIVALSFDKDPRYISLNILKNKLKDKFELSTFCKSYKERTELLERRLASKDFNNYIVNYKCIQRIKLNKLLPVLEALEIKLPQQILELINKATNRYISTKFTEKERREIIQGKANEIIRKNKSLLKIEIAQKIHEQLKEEYPTLLNNLKRKGNIGLEVIKRSFNLKQVTK